VTETLVIGELFRGETQNTETRYQCKYNVGTMLSRGGCRVCIGFCGFGDENIWSINKIILPKKNERLESLCRQVQPYNMYGEAKGTLNIFVADGRLTMSMICGCQW